MKRITDKIRAQEANRILRQLYPEAECSLEANGDPWRLLVMARLSAQCTDERVNIVCRSLFEAFPSAEAMAAAPLADIEQLVKPCGLYRGKAKSIKEASQLVISKYNGNIPSSMEELLTLPGVGRKIANLLLGDIFGLGGIVADTHCMRICSRLGFYPEGQKDPLKTEKIMEKLIPKEHQSDFCHRIVHFGRDICKAKNPLCGQCPMMDICRHYSNNHKKKAGS